MDLIAFLGNALLVLGVLALLLLMVRVVLSGTVPLSLESRIEATLNGVFLFGYIFGAVIIGILRRDADRGILGFTSTLLVFQGLVITALTIILAVFSIRAGRLTSLSNLVTISLIGFIIGSLVLGFMGQEPTLNFAGFAAIVLALAAAVALLLEATFNLNLSRSGGVLWFIFIGGIIAGLSLVYLPHFFAGIHLPWQSSVA